MLIKCDEKQVWILFFCNADNGGLVAESFVLPEKEILSLVIYIRLCSKHAKE
jgi:hypothetical protein